MWAGVSSPEPPDRSAAMIIRKPTNFQRYAVAVFAVVVAFGLRYGIYGTLDYRIPFGFFTIATLIAAWYGGLGPGLLAALTGLLLADHFFLPPHRSDSGTLGEVERTAIGAYAMTSTLIVVLFWRLHSRLRELEDQVSKLQGGEAPSK
jgi:K+-sensing histidine kinase KdpD